VRTTALDRILTSTPNTKTAALVTGKGIHWEPRHTFTVGEVWQDTPPPTFPLPSGANSNNGTSAMPIGFRVCRLTVVGYGSQGANGARWVVRCACGFYGHRRAKFLRSEDAKTRGMCSRCDYLEELKRGYVPAGPLSAAVNINPPRERPGKRAAEPTPTLADVMPAELRRRTG
jgi:hypothetical protein